MTLGDFTQQAESYAASRPGYPAELLDQLMEDAGVRAGDAVAEIGAGTGLFTRMLAERGLSVTAIEPNDEMRGHAFDLPNVRWVKGTFEETTLPDRSQQWCVAAQAFHWATLPDALHEMRRILTPDGALTVLWNDRMREGSDMVAWTDQAISQYVPEFNHNYRKRPWSETLISTGDFTQVTCRAVRHTVVMLTERYLNLWRSHNQLNVVAGPQRFTQFHQALADELKARNLQSVDVPYVCEAWTGRLGGTGSHAN